MSTPVAGSLAVVPLFATPADAVVWWDDPGQTWQQVAVTGGGGGTITLSGDVTGSGTSSIVVELTDTGVTAGSYTNTNLTVDVDGRVTAASSGPAASGTVQSGTSGQIAMYSATFAVHGVTMAGDATIDATGLLNLNNNSVDNSEIVNGAVTYAKIQNVGAARLLGNPTGAAAAPSEISLGTGLAFAGSVLNATGGATGLSGMVAGQIPIAASATTVTSSANLSGDVTSNAALATTLATVNANVGTFQGLTVDGKGRVTAAANQGYATSAAMTTADNLRVLKAGDTMTGNLIVAPTTVGMVKVSNTAAGVTATDGLEISMGTSNAYVWSYENVPLIVGTNNTEQMRFLTSGSMSMAGSLAITTPGGWSSLIVNSIVGTDNQIVGERSGGVRWVIVPGNGVAESGGNAGTDFAINRYSDAGAYIDAPITIVRSTGLVTFYNLVRVANASLTIGAPTAWPTLVLNGNGGTGRVLRGQTAGSTRWDVSLGSTAAESGANAGSDLTIERYTDAGGWLGYGLAITRATGACANTSGTWTSISEASLKQDVMSYTRGLDAITALNPVAFRYRPGTPFAAPDAPSEIMLGLIADQVAPHIPEIVGRMSVQIRDEHDEHKYTDREVDTLNNGHLIFALINAVKELAARVAALEGNAAG